MKLFLTGVAGAGVAKFAFKKPLQTSLMIGLATLGTVCLLTAKSDEA